MRAAALGLFMLTTLALGGCDRDDFDTRFAREQEEINRQAAQIDKAMANDMAAAREADRAAQEAREDEQEKR